LINSREEIKRKKKKGTNKKEKGNEVLRGEGMTQVVTRRHS